MVEFSTREYQISHGNLPRGYGNWAFEFNHGAATLWHLGKFSDAKMYARRYAVSQGYSHVEVMP